jgi:hypothetical protein
MQKLNFRSVVFTSLLAMLLPLRAEENGLIGWWKFDNIRIERKPVKMVRGETFIPKEVFGYVKNSINGVESDLYGKFFKQVKGISEGAVLLDGNTAFIEVAPKDVPRVSGDFSVEAWIALGAYPDNLCPIVDNQRDPAEGYYNGYFFGLDALGRLVLKIATHGREETCMIKETLPLNRWIHVAGTYSPQNGLRLYVNGRLAAAMNTDFDFTPAQRSVNLLMGRSRQKRRPHGTIRPHGTQEFYAFFDGLLDEVKIYEIELTAADIKSHFSSLDSDQKPELPDRRLPTGALSPGYFGAINTTLKYYEAYDALYHVSKWSDLVVRFDEYPCEFVFWRGANYQAHLVTEKGFWFNNGFNEGWSEYGSAEPMSDKQIKYSRVKVLESNDARVVVQWRYALVDNWNAFAFYDPATGWGDWTEETFYIYPDMVAVREDVLLSNAPRAAHEWQESMVVLGPGQKPTDVLEYTAMTLGNDKGDFYTYSWEKETPPRFPPEPKNPCIQLVNMKSKYKLFSILRPQDNPKIDVYSGEIRREVSVFPWWNHWPVAQKPTDGRYAMFADRPSHSSLSHWSWDAYEETDRSMTKLMLIGLTDKCAEELLRLGRSWYNPAEFKGARGVQGKYDQTQRAWVIQLQEGAEECLFQLLASETSPVINPAFLVKHWGRDRAGVEINGKPIPRSKAFRVGYIETLEGTDLIVWLKFTSTKPIRVKVTRMK